MFCDCQFTHTTGWGGAGNGKRSHQAMLWRRLYDMQSLDYTSKGEATGQRPVGKYWRTKDNGDHFDLRELVAVPNKTEWQENYNKKFFMSTASLQQLLEILKRVCNLVHTISVLYNTIDDSAFFISINSN